MLELWSMCILTGQCSEDMATEGNGPVSTSFENEPLDNNEPWKPTGGQDKELLFRFPKSAVVTSVQLIDEEAGVTFNAYYQTEEGGPFLPYTDDNGQVIVSSNETNDYQ